MFVTFYWSKAVPFALCADGGSLQTVCHHGTMPRVNAKDGGKAKATTKEPPPVMGMDSFLAAAAAGVGLGGSQETSQEEADRAIARMEAELGDEAAEPAAMEELGDEAAEPAAMEEVEEVAEPAAMEEVEEVGEPVAQPVRAAAVPDAAGAAVPDAADAAGAAVPDAAGAAAGDAAKAAALRVAVSDTTAATATTAAAPASGGAAGAAAAGATKAAAAPLIVHQESQMDGLLAELVEKSDDDSNDEFDEDDDGSDYEADKLKVRIAFASLLPICSRLPLPRVSLSCLLSCVFAEDVPVQFGAEAHLPHAEAGGSQGAEQDDGQDHPQVLVQRGVYDERRRREEEGAREDFHSVRHLQEVPAGVSFDGRRHILEGVPNLQDRVRPPRHLAEGDGVAHR